MTIRFLPYATKEDRDEAAFAFSAAGIKARFRMLNRGFRIVFVGAWQDAAKVLNDNGFRVGGGNTFSHSGCFNDTNPLHGEVFVTYREKRA